MYWNLFQHKDYYKNILLFLAYVFWSVLFDKKLIILHQGNKAMYKTRNTETGNVILRTWGMGGGGGGGLIFRGLSPNIPGNISKHSGECSQTFRWMSPNIPGNVAEHSG